MRAIRSNFFEYLFAVSPLFFVLSLFEGFAFVFDVNLFQVILFFAFIYFVIREQLWQISWFEKNWQVWRQPILIVFYMLLALMGFWPAIFGSLYFFIAKKVFFDKKGLAPLAVKSWLFGVIILAIYLFANPDIPVLEAIIEPGFYSFWLFLAMVL
ncbi:hypothetical protein HOH67_00165 [Candidatus Peregrinibacteria bacterium]|jgi:hypothetical protein|nr:hypothetical protein [Candidatus Peregrinibacteria bacterium]MBT5823530.1 hypothetical protein [Candidatus Peregrinibacteria bacterium]